jgi:hypothetical protein
MKGVSRRMLAAVIVVVGCAENSAVAPETNALEGRLQVVPGVAELSAVDVVVDGQVRLTGVAYGRPSSALALSTGQHVVKVVPPAAGASTGGTSVTIRANDTTTVVVIGTAAALNPVTLGDTGAAPVPGKGKLRVSHLATNAPPIDVYRSQPDFPSFIKLMDPFPYRASSPFVESTPGNWVIRVTARNSTQILAESPPIRVDALWVRTVVLLDAPNGGIRITLLGEQ